MAIKPEVPEIVIFVRHKPTCSHAGRGELYMQCRCKKHLRWSIGGKQYRRSAKTRLLAEAEREKKRVEMSYLTGAALKPTGAPLTIKRCAETFIQMKKDENVSADVIRKYTRELARLEKWMAQHAAVLPSQMNLDLLIGFRATWEAQYPSSQTRQKVQERLRGFLRYLHSAGHIQTVPELKAIQVDPTPTLPFTDQEYKELLGLIPKAFPGDKEQVLKLRALIQLGRYSGLAIHDASTFERHEVVRDEARKVYRIVVSRQKTGVHVSVVIPDDVARELLAVVNDNPNYVFWHGNGDPESAAKYWQKEIRENLYPLWKHPEPPHFHRLRDTFAVDLLTRGVPLDDVSKLLGHKSVKTTERSYAPWVKARQDRLDDLVIAARKKKS